MSTRNYNDGVDAYIAVNIHHIQKPKVKQALTGGTKMIRNSSLTNIAAVFMTATANRSLLKIQMKAIIDRPMIPRTMYVMYLKVIALSAAFCYYWNVY